jgi:hypothetical protein
VKRRARQRNCPYPRGLSKAVPWSDVEARVADANAEGRDGDTLPQEALRRLPQRPQEQGVAGGARDQRPPHLPRRQAHQELCPLGADLHRHQRRSALRRAAQLGGQERQDDPGKAQRLPRRGSRARITTTLSMPEIELRSRHSNVANVVFGWCMR